MSPPEVPFETVQKWQEIVNIIAEIMRVPSALVMKVEPPNIKVFVSSESNSNPYERNELAPLNTGLYCETVMKTRQSLLVPDALCDEEWKSNPDIKLGMISYLGFPVSWPDGQIFGTICVLDRKENSYSESYRKFVSQCRDVLEADLRAVARLSGELTRSEAYLEESSEVQSYRELRLAGFHRRDRLVKGKLQNIWIRPVACRHFRQGYSTRSSGRSCSRTKDC